MGAEIINEARAAELKEEGKYRSRPYPRRSVFLMVLNTQLELSPRRKLSEWDDIQWPQRWECLSIDAAPELELNPSHRGG